MTQNKTVPTDVSVDAFLQTVSEKRQAEASQLIAIMQSISSENPVMWGPSIIGFGSKHYAYDSGREGDVPVLGFSPRKTAITIYFNEGFDQHGENLKLLGKHTHSVSCLYINKLDDIDISVLQNMLSVSYAAHTSPSVKPGSVDDYIGTIPANARPQFDELRKLMLAELPDATEVVSYGIVGYKVDAKRPRVFISGWKDHVAVYPIPKNDTLKVELQPYIRGKGTLWFSLNDTLPKELLRKVVRELTLS